MPSGYRAHVEADCDGVSLEIRTIPPLNAAELRPFGLQLIGRPFDESTLFTLGEVIERNAGRHPVVERWWEA